MLFILYKFKKIIYSEYWNSEYWDSGNRDLGPVQETGICIIDFEKMVWSDKDLIHDSCISYLLID
jgi:hypothetical protein